MVAARQGGRADNGGLQNGAVRCPATYITRPLTPPRRRGGARRHDRPAVRPIRSWRNRRLANRLSAPRRGGWVLRGGAAGSGRARGAGPATRREGERILPPFFNRPARAPSGLAMAPLLGRKPFPLAKPLPPGEQGELFVIPHTQEAFRTREYPPHRGAGGGRGGSRGRGAEQSVVGSGG